MGIFKDFPKLLHYWKLCSHLCGVSTVPTIPYSLNACMWTLRDVFHTANTTNHFRMNNITTPNTIHVLTPPQDYIKNPTKSFRHLQVSQLCHWTRLWR